MQAQRHRCAVAQDLIHSVFPFSDQLYLTIRAPFGGDFWKLIHALKAACRMSQAMATFSLEKGMGGRSFKILRLRPERPINRP